MMMIMTKGVINDNKFTTVVQLLFSYPADLNRALLRYDCLDSLHGLIEKYALSKMLRMCDKLD